jgi:hypothetical protein
MFVPAISTYTYSLSSDCVFLLSEDDNVNAGGPTIDSKLSEQNLADGGNGSSNGPGSVAALRVHDGEGRTQGQQGQSSQVNVAVKEDYDSSATVS